MPVLDAEMSMTDQKSDNTTIEYQIESLVRKCGGLRKLSRKSGVAVGYLCRLRKGEKLNPSESTLRKLGLKREVIVSYKSLSEENGDNDG